MLFSFQKFKFKFKKIIAKNVILAGVHSLAIWDDRKVELSDLSTQFFLKEDDIGKPRATACRDRLAELNTYVPVSVLDNLNEESISKFHVFFFFFWISAFFFPLQI